MTLRQFTNPFPILIGGYAAAIALAPGFETKVVLAAPFVLAPFAAWIVLAERRWIAVFFVAALLLPPLPIALGDTGPHPALVIAALGMFAGVLRLREFELRIGGMGFAMIALFTVLLGSTALAAVYSGGAIAAASLARVLLFGIAVYMFLYTAYGPGRYSANESHRATRFLFLVACGSALFACVDFWFQFPTPAGYEQQFLWLDSGVYRRAQGVFYEASTLGNFCAFFIVMILVALLRKQSWRPCSRKVLIAGAVLFSAVLIFSYSRASLLNVAVALIAFAWLQRVKIRRAVIVAASSAGAAALIVVVAFPELAHNYWVRLTGTTELLTGSAAALSGRVESWQALWNFLITNPWHAILGIGYKTLPYSDFTGRPVVADNMYLSLLLETGIVGLGVFVAFNIAVLRAMRRASSSADPQTAFFGRWLFCFWAGEMFQMLSGDLLTYWRVLPVYFWALALAVRNEHSVSRSV